MQTTLGCWAFRSSGSTSKKTPTADTCILKSRANVIIEIPGNPIPQARMRLFRRGGANLCWDPNGKDKQIVRLFLTKHLPPGYVYPKNAQISFIFYMPIPKSMRKPEKLLADQGLLKHTKKPDVDNLIKFYFDCLTGIFIEDDAQVSIGHAVKLYHPKPKTAVCIMETSNTLLQPPDVAFYCPGFCKSTCATIDLPDDSEYFFDSDVPQSA